MDSLSQLRKEKARVLKQQKRNDEISKLKGEIFQAKHSGKIRTLKIIGTKLRGYAENYQARTQGVSKASKSNNKNPFGEGSVFNPRSIWG